MPAIASSTISSQKILILNTGGTLSCLPVKDFKDEFGTIQYAKDVVDRKQDGLIPQKGLVKHLFDTLFESEKDNVVIVDSSTFIDSSDASPESWNNIISGILSNIDTSISGVIVIHGTDTLAYTASAISFYLNHTLPIIVTGSQFPFARWKSFENNEAQSNNQQVFLTVKNHVEKHDAQQQVIVELNGTTDAFSNLYGSIEMMREMIKEKACGVFVFFNNKLMKGTRVRKVHTDNIDAFESVNCLPVGKFNVESVVLKLDLMQSLSKPNHFILRHVTQVEKEIQSKLEEKKINDNWNEEMIFYSNNGSVEMLRVYPGIKELLFEGRNDFTFQNKKICVLLTYGAGNLPSNINDKVKENKETTYLSCSECYNGKGSQNYSTSCVNENCVSLFDMTPETALVKAHYVRKNFITLKEEWIENRHVFSLFSETLGKLLFLNDFIVKFANQYFSERKACEHLIKSLGDIDKQIDEMKNMKGIFLDKCPTNDQEIVKSWSKLPQQIRLKVVKQLDKDQFNFDSFFQNLTNAQLSTLTENVNLKSVERNFSSLHKVKHMSEGMKQWGCPVILEFLEHLELDIDFQDDLSKRGINFSHYILPEVLKGIFSFETVSDIEFNLLKLEDLKLFQIIMRYSFNGEVINHDSRRSKDAFNML